MFKKIISSLIVFSLTVLSLTLPETILKPNKVSAEMAFEDPVIKTMDYKITPDGKYIYDVLDDGNVEIVRYTGKRYNVKLPSEIDGKTVTTIGCMNIDAEGDLGGGITDGSVVGAFQECDIRTIELPDTITKIDYLAFSYCKELSEIKFSNNLQEIGDYAFYECEGLEKITFPLSLKKIDYRAFGNCRKLKTVTIPKSVQDLGSNSLGYMITLYYPFDSKKIDGFSINCYKGTSGEQYAIDNGFDYELLDSIGTVSGFKASSVSANAVKLTWNKVSDAQGYIVYKYDNSKKTWIRIDKTNTTANTYTVSKLSSGTSYKFAVRAYKYVNGKEITSSSFPTVTATTLMPTVTGFKASSVSASAVKLTWNKVSDAQGYIVYKYDNSKKTWIRVVKTTNTSNVYTVSKLSSGTSYKFAVKAYKTVNGKEVTSSNFPTVTAITKLPTVVNERTAIGRNSVKLTWQKTTGAQGYIVYKYDNSKKTWVRIAKTRSLNYLVKNLRANTNYKFTVKAYKYVSGKEITSVSFTPISVKTKK